MSKTLSNYFINVKFENLPSNIDYDINYWMD